ncbi:MAG: FAD-dependent monooxygenase [Blastococcus sp.]|jgi:2-polyprenyl-6-methoxyphenol hydroxylase-like FAD-dependent oxidoreductase|nr:FAD-dependent monooxygenase [Blastococcus sp.]
MAKKTVAIAGAGIAGFAAAAALAQHDFEVRIYERSEEPREFGAGIYLKENSLAVLDALGVGGQLAESGVRLRAAMIHDETGKTIVRRTLDKERLLIALRSELHSVLRAAALAAGAELVTGREAASADPSGVLHMSDGEEVKADLVVAADGVNSRIRESLKLTRLFALLGDGATRVIIPREEEAYANEYWNGSLRVGVAPCSEDYTYAFIIGPERDRRATALPLDRAYWAEAFPAIASVFERVGDGDGVHHTHSIVICKELAAGNVAVIGDAAHAQPPNFGQGAGLAIDTSWEMAETLAGATDIAQGLQAWQDKVRRRVTTVQALTTAYDIAQYKCPKPLAPLRSRLFELLGSVPTTAHQWEFWWRGGVAAPQPAIPWTEVAG